MAVKSNQKAQGRGPVETALATPRSTPDSEEKFSPKKPTHVDQHVADRLRLRRILLGLSQDDLAQRLGLTAQQIQKYEAGKTRISASRLYDLSLQLAVPITWFFEDLEEHTPRDTMAKDAELSERVNVHELMTRHEARQLVELYFGIRDEHLRSKVMEVAELLQRSK